MIKQAQNLIEKLWMHKGVRHYGVNTSWLFAEKIFRMAIAFTVGIYVARQLGPAQYGLLNYAISFVGIFSIAAGLGLESIVVRELVKYPEKRNKILGSTFVLKLAGFFVMLAGVWLALYLKNDNQSTNSIILVITAGYLFQIFQTIDLYFQSQVLSKYVAISQFIAWSLVSCGRAFCAWQGYPLIYFAWLEAINMCLMSLGYLFFYMINVSQPFNWRFDFFTSKGLLNNSWPLLLSGAAGMIYMRIDQVMLESMLGVTEVGYYSMAVRLVELWYFLPMIICSSLFPSIVRAKNISRKHYLHRVQMLFVFMFWMAVVIMLLATFAGTFIIKQFLENYITSIPVLVIYSWKLIFCFMGVASSQYFVAENLQKYCLIFALIGAAINVVLNYIFIKTIGINGAAWASLIASCAVVYLGPLLFKPTRNVFGMLVKILYFKQTFLNRVEK